MASAAEERERRGPGVGTGGGVRNLLGLLALAVGCFIAGDAVHRLRTAVEWTATSWPWLLLTLALINLLRTAMTIGSLVAPGLLAAVAAGGLLASKSVSEATLTDLLLPGTLVVTGTVLLRPSLEPESIGTWTRVLTTSRVRAPDAVGNRTRHARLTLRAVAGEVRADFTGSALDGELSINVTAIGGHVHLTVPHTWPVVVHTSGAVLTHVTETASRPHAGDGSAGIVGLHILGLCGAVSLARA